MYLLPNYFNVKRSSVLFRFKKYLLIEETAIHSYRNSLLMDFIIIFYI